MPSESQKRDWYLGFMFFLVIGLPFLAGVALMPFWQKVGEWEFVERIDQVLTPGIFTLPDVEGGPVTLRRFLVASSLLLYILFLIQIVFVWRSKRLRFMYLAFYDLKKKALFKIFAIVAAMFGFLWYAAFIDPAMLHTQRSGRLVIMLPLLTIALGQMLSILALGAMRDLTHAAQRFR